MDPVVDATIRLAFALLLGLAAIGKARGFTEFRFIVADYRVVPASMAPAAALALIAVEAFLAVMWVAGTTGAIVGAATACLLGFYGAAIALNLLRGRVFISCGCGFGRTGGAQLSWWLVARNAALVVLAFAASWLDAGARSMGLLDYFTVSMALAATVLLYAVFHQLLDNRERAGHWTRGVRG